MKSILKFLANPIFTGTIAFCASLPLLSRDLKLTEYIWSLPVIFITFSLPFIFISLYTKNHIRDLKSRLSLIGMWLGSVIAAVTWIAIIYSSDGGQAAAGFFFVPSVTVIGGIIGYALFKFAGNRQ